MIMTGQYRLALHPDADAEAFEKFMTSVVFEESGVLQLTRITNSFQSSLLKTSAPESDAAYVGRLYVWQVAVGTVNDKGYDFEQNADRVQTRVADQATLTGVEEFINV
jgi:hypothetical protein